MITVRANNKDGKGQHVRWYTRGASTVTNELQEDSSGMDHIGQASWPTGLLDINMNESHTRPYHSIHLEGRQHLLRSLHGNRANNTQTWHNSTQIGCGTHGRIRRYSTQIGVKSAKMLYNIFLNGLKFAIFV